MSTLLERMQTLMAEADIKPRQMTTILGISVSSFTDWNKGKGKPSLETVVKFADYFNVSIDWLTRGEHFNDPNVVMLDFSNTREKELLDKFRQLTPELQEGLLRYADGMLAAMPVSNQEQRLSV